jgi:hypothetical protein
MRVAENLDWKGLKIKKSAENRKIIMSDEVRHYDRKGFKNPNIKISALLPSSYNCPGV